MWKALIKLVEKWAYKCKHNWKLEEKVNIYQYYTSKLPYKIKTIYRCHKCCEVKTTIS